MIFNNVEIEWINHHAGFKLKYQGKIIYIDPWEVDDYEVADLILITHMHYDHFSPEDIEKLSKDDTIIIAPHDVALKVGSKAKPIKPNEMIKVGDIRIDAVPAYNEHRFRSPGVPFHPKDQDWVGYIIRLGDVRIYHAGDTDKIEEMKFIKADVALLPIGGTYTMDAKEAAEAANLLQPQLVIPMHWGTIVGGREHLDEFTKLCHFEVKSLEEVKADDYKRKE